MRRLCSHNSHCRGERLDLVDMFRKRGFDIVELRAEGDESWEVWVHGWSWAIQLDRLEQERRHDVEQAIADHGKGHSKVQALEYSYEGRKQAIRRRMGR